jgi:ribosomal protein S18 acetylase RimI-like enzyme
MSATYHRMRIDHDREVPDPELPEGVTVASGGEEKAVRRDAHAIHQTSFTGQFGFVEQDFEQWHEGFDASVVHDWGQLQVAYVDGQPSAMLLGNDQFVEDEQCGYVRLLGVLPKQRGRGLARLLLRRAFARDVRAGRVGTLLHVNTANPTPALDLYQSVGMRVVLVIDVWRRSVSA